MLKRKSDKKKKRKRLRKPLRRQSVKLKRREQERPPKMPRGEKRSLREGPEKRKKKLSVRFARERQGRSKSVSGEKRKKPNADVQRIKRKKLRTPKSALQTVRAPLTR